MPSVTDFEGNGRGPEGRERAALVGLITGDTRRTHVEDALDELAGLADAADIEPVIRFTQDRNRPDPATLIGSGKLEMLKAACQEADLSLAIFDNELTPAQLRNIEKILELRVIDRTQLILDIFARRARTREGKLQVELAQLRYLLPRLVGASAALSRLGGGIGTRGPGETKLETDRRRIRLRIGTLTDDLAEVRRRRGQLRDRRRRSELPAVALVGYTNAGKTTLFNRLTNDTRRRVRCVVRHARSADARAEAAQPAARRAVGHGRLHRSPAAHAGRGLPRHARGSRRRRPAAARRRCLDRRLRAAHAGGGPRARRSGCRRRARCCSSSTRPIASTTAPASTCARPTRARCRFRH